MKKKFYWRASKTSLAIPVLLWEVFEHGVDLIAVFAETRARAVAV
jgi:hypothetical protein